MEPRKMVLMNIFAGQQWRQIQRTNLTDIKEGRRGWDEWREQHGNIYTTIYITASGNFLYESRNSNQGSVTTQRRGMGQEVGGRFRREGTYVDLWLIHVDVWQKPTQHCKEIILQLKINKFLKSGEKQKILMVVTTQL